MCAKYHISDRYGYDLTVFSQCLHTPVPILGVCRLFSVRRLRMATHFHDRPRTVGHGGMNNVRRMNDLVAVRHMKLMKLNVLSIKKLLS